MSRWFIGSTLSLFLAGCALAQTASVGGPLAGFIYDSGSRTVRPLHGVPGSTHIGSPVLNGVDLASIAPGGQWAFVTKNGGSTFVRGLSDASTTESLPDGLLASVDRVVWNRDGSAVLLYSSSANQLQRVRLSATDATADAPLDLPAGSVTALAIDPAGRQIALGIAATGLYLFNAGDSPVLISSIAQPAAAAFDETGRKLYAVDLDSLRIVQFDSGSAQSDFTAIGSGIAPAGLAISAGGRYLMLADSAASAVYVYDVASQSFANTLNLDFAPSRFEPLSSGPTFLLNGGRSGEWLLVLDARQIPGITIVPAAAGEELQ